MFQNEAKRWVICSGTARKDLLGDVVPEMALPLC
jgi:hypothetical protein